MSGVWGTGLRLGVLAVLAAASVAACGSTVLGTAQPAGPVVRPTSSFSGPPAQSSGPAAPPSAGTLNVDLCTLLSWKDFNYGDVGNAKSPTQSGNQAGWSQFCLWQSQQFNAGYTPPPEPNCDKDDNAGNAGGALSCLDQDTEQFAQIEEHSAYVNVAVGWRPDHIKVTPTTSYTRDGIKVYLDGGSVTSSCIGDLRWANGTLQVEVQDSTKANGTPCAQVTELVNLMIIRQPH
ncbi:MAG TPA: hypothetical protein VFW65_09310 [Pseudonocardiaceae bacterium]|nr:hypothetical protein [Pseudonocardiaceae bacterium]